MAPSKLADNFHPRLIAERVFSRIRRDFQLGLSEYLAALEALAGGWGIADEEDLKTVLELLWCHSPGEQEHFRGIFDSVTAAISQRNKQQERRQQRQDEEDKNREIIARESASDLEKESERTSLQTAYNLGTAPVRAPFMPAEFEETADFQSDFPLSRRSLLYHWRYLRRPVADGIQDVLDVEATVNQTAGQGFFLHPVYNRREINHAHLLLMVDRNGSMVPFHRFTRELVETAQFESEIERVDVCYFHNIPTKNVYRDFRLTEPFLKEDIFDSCDSDTSILIVSDGGAARGYRDLARIQETMKVLIALKQRTNHIAWLNPMPEERWLSTSAQMIAYLVPMYGMNQQGFSNAIDTIRGQPIAQFH